MYWQTACRMWCPLLERWLLASEVILIFSEVETGDETCDEPRR